MSYGTPLFERPRSAGPGMGGGGFIPPPPGASQGGEPGQYPPFQQGYPSPYGWPTPNSLPPQHSTWTHGAPQHAFQPSQTYPHPSSWTYGQYPPSPDDPTAHRHPSVFPQTPITPTSTSRYSPYSSQPYQQPPPTSAPAHLAPWSQQFQHPQQSQYSMPSMNYVDDRAPLSRSFGAPSNTSAPLRSAMRRPSTQSQHSIPPIPYVDDHTSYTQPKPFGGSANALAPRKSAMKRSRSQSATDRQLEFQPQKMEPSTSGGSGFSSGSFGRRAAEPVIPPPSIPSAPVYIRQEDETYTATNLSSRPRDWRAEYSTKQGISSYLPKIGKVRTDVEEYTDTIKRGMHPLLLHALENPPLAFDLRCTIIEGPNILFQTLGRNCNEVDLAQFAAHPTAPMLRLYHPRLPWYVDIHQSHPNGVTVFDVLVQLSRQMQAPIHSRHYYNETLDSADRAALAKSFKERVRSGKGERGKGVLQVDFLGEKCVLEGLVRGKQGMWEMKLRRPER